MANIFDSVVDFSKIDPNDIFEGFHKKFVLISQMKHNDLLTVKQTLDLILRRSNQLNEQEEEILMHIMGAMQTQVQQLCRQGCGSDALRELFYMQGTSEKRQFHYDKTKKGIFLGNKPNTEQKQTIHAEESNTRKRFGWF